MTDSTKRSILCLIGYVEMKYHVHHETSAPIETATSLRKIIEDDEKEAHDNAEWREEQWKEQGRKILSRTNKRDG